MVPPDRKVSKLAAAAVADQAATGKDVDRQIHQGHQAQHHKTGANPLSAKQDHGDQSGQDHDEQSGHLGEILAGEQLSASADRAAAQTVFIVNGLVPVQVDIRPLAVGRLGDARPALQVDFDPAQTLMFQISHRDAHGIILGDAGWRMPVERSAHVERHYLTSMFCRAGFVILSSTVSLTESAIQHPLSNIRYPASAIRHLVSGIQHPTSSMPPLTRNQVRRVDQLAIQQLGIPGLVLMENAGRQAATAVLELLGNPQQARVAVVCGGGNNGGDGYVVARHLHNKGVSVSLHPAKNPTLLTGDTLVNARIAQNMKLPFARIDDEEQRVAALANLNASDVIVDALLGTGFCGPVRPHTARIIEACNAAGRQGASVVALDVPSGLDCDSGQASDPTITADLTVTFVAPKVGFTQPQAIAHLGKIIVADIGAPPSLIDLVVG